MANSIDSAAGTGLKVSSNARSTTLADETKSLYAGRARSFVLSFLQAHPGLPCGAALDSAVFVKWLAPRWASYRSATRRLNRAALQYYFAEQGWDVVPLQGLPVAMGSTHDRHLPARTSSSKRKALPPDLEASLVRALGDSGGGLDRLAADWLVLTRMVGLRPVEWQSAAMVDYRGVPALRVNNAKCSQGRSHGPLRFLLLDRMAAEDQSRLAAFLADLRVAIAAQGGFEDLYRAIRQQFRLRSRGTSQKAGRVSLYSARHQFSADAKAAGYSPFEIAAMMGHGVDTTNAVHYGKRRNGANPCHVRPCPEDVLRVRRVLVPREFSRTAPRASPST